MTEPTDIAGLMALVDQLVEHAREDDRMCYDHASSQRFQDARDELQAVLAKWGTPPAVAGEPYAYAVYFPDQPTEELVHDLDELCDDLTNREHTITKLYATPQPTQAQAGAVPLTDERLDAAVEAWFGSDNNYDFRERMRAAIDASHGIKGGQHGDSTA